MQSRKQWAKVELKSIRHLRDTGGRDSDSLYAVTADDGSRILFKVPTEGQA